ncbi:site-specific integrase [Niallia taxi]|uniref:site-specific integrase n=1 Tax=Niallia taxi TaxID=2499688 RepID=UPI0015F76E97|nr:site-specific integrase [Niallia taxi]
MIGYVYFFFSKAYGITKIGSSKDPENRLVQLGANTPWKMEFVFSIRDNRYKSIEKEFHKRFTEEGKKVPDTNEFFFLTFTDILKVLQEYPEQSNLQSYEWVKISSLYNHVEIKRKCYEICNSIADNSGTDNTTQQLNELIEFSAEYTSGLTPTNRTTLGQTEELEKPQPLSHVEIKQSIQEKKVLKLKRSEKAKKKSIKKSKSVSNKRIHFNPASNEVPQKWTKLHEEYGTHLENQYESEKTVRGYLNNSASFLAFIQHDLDNISDTEESHVLDFAEHLANGLGYSNNTIARHLSSLRNFFKYLRSNNLMVVNPMDDIKQPELNRRETPELTEDDVALMEEYTKKTSGCPERDLLLIHLLFYEKLKVSDAIEITKEHYDRNSGVVVVNGKEHSIQNITKPLLDKEYKNAESPYFLYNHNYKKLTESGAYFILKSLFKAIGKPHLRPIDLSKKQASNM